MPCSRSSALIRNTPSFFAILVPNCGVYAQVSVGGSAGGGFFLPRFRTDGLLNRKLLHNRQFVATVGLGFDQSKTVNHDLRGQVGAAYYFQFPVVLQGGVTWTHANPGGILARSQFIAATQGHDKEHFFSLRYEWARRIRTHRRSQRPGSRLQRPL